MMRNIVLIWKESRVIPWLFSLSWEQRKVGDILSDVERPIAMLDDETYQLVTVKRRNEGIVSRGYLKGKDILVKNYYRIHAGDFLISKRQVIHGANGYVPKSLDNAVVSNEYMVAVSNNDISTAFWALMSQRKEMYQMYLFSSYGVDVEKMVFNVDDWKKRSVIIPKLEEQTVIVSFFSKLDNLITLHHRQEKRSGHNPFQMQRRITFTWEQREFGETFDFLTNNTLSRAELNDETGSVLNVHYGDILVKFGEIIDTETDHLPHISDVTKVVRPAFLMDGDVIIADTAEDNTVGKCAEIIGIADKLVVSGLHTIPCRPRRQFAQGYLGYFMNSPAFHDQLLPLMQGTKVASVSKSAMADTLICYPADVTEQAFIGQYFMKLDNLITLHQREYFKRQTEVNYVKYNQRDGPVLRILCAMDWCL